MARVRIIFRAPPSKTGNVLYDWRARCTGALAKGTAWAFFLLRKSPSSPRNFRSLL